MGRAPCCDKATVKRGPWSPDDDAVLRTYIQTHGTGGNWISLPRKAGLKRCGKSCRLRWLNYLRPDIKHGGFTEEEDTIILSLYNSLGSRWSVIASHLHGRTDNEVKNYWNTKLKKKATAAPISFLPNLVDTASASASAAYIPHSPSPAPPLPPTSGYGYTQEYPSRLFWELTQFPPMSSNFGPPMEGVSSTTATMDSSYTNWSEVGEADDWIMSELGFGLHAAAPPLGGYGEEAAACYNATTTSASDMWVAQDTKTLGLCQNVIYS